jgi:hypothetical protein
LSKDRRFTWRSNQSKAKAEIEAGDYVLLNCGASVLGENRDEMLFTSACEARPG